jgi:hypothetical protein
MDYSETDLKRMRYYLPELEEKFKQNPRSLVLRNGIAHIREVLGLPKTVSPIDPITFLSDERAKIEEERRGR